MNKLFFPQGTLSIEDNKPAQEIAFSVCGGRKPAAAWLNMTAEKLPGMPEFFAADKGLDYYHAARFYPDKVIGDGDSADPVLWQQAVENGKADIVLTGEGRIDRQTRMGKVPFGVAETARKAGCKKVIAFGGSVVDGAADALRPEIDECFGIMPEGMPLEEAMKEETAKRNMEETVRDVFRSNL